jgi:DNA-binding NtrC family response regulator
MNRYRSLRVLVVDAAPSMAQALSVILKENGHDASPAFSASEALISCRHKWPDVVIIGTLSEPQGIDQLTVEVTRGHPECRVLRISDNLPPSTSQHLRSTDRNFPTPAKPINSRAILSYLNSL